MILNALRDNLINNFSFINQFSSIIIKGETLKKNELFYCKLCFKVFSQLRLKKKLVLTIKNLKLLLPRTIQKLKIKLYS